MEHQQFEQLLSGINEMKQGMQKFDQRQLNMETELQKINDKFLVQEEKMDEKFLRLEEKTDEKFLRLEEKMDEKFLRLEEKTDEKFLSHEEKTDEKFLSHEENMNEKFFRLRGNMDEKFLKLEEKMDHQLLNLETRTERIHTQVVKLTEQQNEIFSELKNTAKKDDVAYTEKKLLEHDREIFKIKKHLHMNS